MVSPLTGGVAPVHLGDGDHTVGDLGGFFAVVGISQALMFKGDKPREASMISGTAFAFFGMILLAMVEGGSTESAVTGAFCSIFWGPIAGYFAGTVIGGIWLVADYLRQWLEQLGLDTTESPNATDSNPKRPENGLH